MLIKPEDLWVGGRQCTCTYMYILKNFSTAFIMYIHVHARFFPRSEDYSAPLSPCVVLVQKMRHPILTCLNQLIDHIPPRSQGCAVHLWNGNWTCLCPKMDRPTRSTHSSRGVISNIKWWPQFLCLIQGSLATHEGTQDPQGQANFSTGYTCPYQSGRVQYLAAIQLKNSVCRQQNNTVDENSTMTSLPAPLIA